MTFPTRERVNRARVLVVGDAMLDRYWFGAVDRISPEAPVPVVRVSREEERLGGAANAALNARTLGAQVTLLTVVGNDEPARVMESILERSGIAALMVRDSRMQTVIKLRIIGHSQQMLRVDFESTPDHQALATVLVEYERAVPGHDAVLFSDYGKGGLKHVARMIELARAAGKPVLVDPKGSDYACYAGATVITPNRAELAQVIGTWSDEVDLQERAQDLRARHRIDSLLLTRSEEGMSLFDAAGNAHVPAQAREVFDVTGAGDTVIATMATMLASGCSARESMPAANRAAGIVVGRFGTCGVSYEELAAARAAGEQR